MSNSNYYYSEVDTRQRLLKAFDKKINLKFGDILDFRDGEPISEWIIIPSALNPDHTLDYFLKAQSEEENTKYLAMLRPVK